MRIAIIGGTGLVGSHLLPRINSHELLLLSRRSAGMSGIREKIASAEDWPALLGGEVIDAAVSALGTTWKKSGSWPAFEAVDRTAVVEFARAARAAGARQMISISSVGADRHSSNRYLAIKGQVEEELAEIEFERVDNLRPGLLRGERGLDRRFGERFGIAVRPLVNLVLQGRLARFAAIDAVRVSEAVAKLLGASAPGVFVHHNRAIHALARA